MADETVGMGEAPVAEGERVGFCQDCGKPLSAATIKTVGSGVFCEPCLERRLAGGTAAGYGYGAGAYAPKGTETPGQAAETYWQAAGYPPPPPVPPPPPISFHTPSPGMAGFLGLIPGVGAMYNGQFAKGVVHLVVFAVLVSLTDNVNGIFGLFVAGWVFYMAFEAFHTARARRDGLPLPDPFGWNNIGERMGFGKGWGTMNPGGAPVPPPSAANPYTGPATGAGADWVGYVPPTNFATTPQGGVAVDNPVPPPAASAPYPAGSYVAEPVTAQAAHSTPYTQVPYASAPPYAPTFGSAPYGVDPTAVPVSSARRFPVGAIWLIALGLLFLLGNISPALQFSWRWLVPAGLALLAVWMVVRRLGYLRRDRALYQRPPLGSLICGLRAPVVLMTLAILIALQSAYILTLGQTWPVLLIAFGGMLVLERTAGRGFAAPTVPVTSPVPPAGWTAAGDPIPPTQGGQ